MFGYPDETLSRVFDILSAKFVLKTVPTKHKGFDARLGPGGKTRSLQGLLESTKKKIGLVTHFLEKISLESQQNVEINIFLKKEGKDISSQISLEFAFTYVKDL